MEEDDYLENNDLKSNLNQSINASFSAGRRITDNFANASFGSVEGYGGDQGIFSQTTCWLSWRSCVRDLTFSNSVIVLNTTNERTCL